MAYFTMPAEAAGHALEYDRLDPGALLRTVIESFGGDEALRVMHNLMQPPVEPAATSGGSQGANGIELQCTIALDLRRYRAGCLTRATALA